MDHLLLNLVRKEGYPLTTRLITMDKTWALQPIEGAAAIIEMLLHLYWQGVKEPLRFFPETSLAFAERLSKGAAVSEALRAAQTAWEGSEFAPGRPSEGADPYLSLCFGELDPFADPFKEIAQLVFDPLMEHQERA
jgi:exodeoxyribonuclease V gamma subunit